MRDVRKQARTRADQHVEATLKEQVDLYQRAHPFSMRYDVRFPVMRALYLDQAEQLAVLEERLRRLEAR